MYIYKHCQLTTFSNQMTSIDSNTLPTTPAHERTLQHDSPRTDTTPSSTPGHEFPGAYPSAGHTPLNVDVSHIAAKTKEISNGVAGAARQYVPGLAVYFPPAPRPSAEISGALPGEKTGLSGPVDEAGLPEERAVDGIPSSCMPPSPPTNTI